MKQLLGPDSPPIVASITIQQIANRRLIEYIDELVDALDDARVAMTAESSHAPPHPITVRAEAITALEQITTLRLGSGDASEEEKAEEWRVWAGSREGQKEGNP